MAKAQLHITLQQAAKLVEAGGLTLEPTRPSKFAPEYARIRDAGGKLHILYLRTNGTVSVPNTAHDVVLPLLPEAGSATFVVAGPPAQGKHQGKAVEEHTCHWCGRKATDRFMSKGGLIQICREDFTRFKNGQIDWEGSTI